MSVSSRLAAARALVFENFGYKAASLVISVTLFMVFRGAGAVQRAPRVCRSSGRNHGRRRRGY